MGDSIITKIIDGFFSSINNEIFGYVIAALLGFFSRVLFLRIPRFFRYVRRKSYIRWKESYFPIDTDTIVLDLAGTTQDDDISGGFVYDYKSVRDTAQYFRLRFPSDVVSEMDNSAYSFSLSDFNTGDHEIFGKNTLSELEMITGIDDISGRIKIASEIEAKLFFAQEQGRNFNGSGFGLRSIKFNRTGNLERPKIDISLYRTDYFTQCVMSRVVMELMKDGQISSEKVFSDRNFGFDVISRKYYPFIVGLAINAFVFTDEGRELTLVRRSANANNNLDHAGKYSSSIDEAFSQYDSDHSTYGHGNVTIRNCFRRGAKEELGVDPDDPRLSNLTVYQVFFVKSLFQVALAGYCTYDGPFEELRSYPAQDKPLEHESMESFSFTPRVMSKLISSDEIIPCIRDILIDLCKLKSIDIDLSTDRGFSRFLKRVYVYVTTLAEALVRIVWR